MPQYIFIYIGGDYPDDPEAGKQHFEQYQKWLADLGEAVLSPAIPFKDTHTVHPDATIDPGTTTLMSGMSVLSFESMQAALAAAKACPFLGINGTLEVSQMLEMSEAAH